MKLCTGHQIAFTVKIRLQKAIPALGYCVLKAQCDKTADRLSKAHILGAHFDVPFFFFFLAEIFVIK